MTTQQANFIQQANARGRITVNDISYLPTILIGVGPHYVAFNQSAKIVQQAVGSFFCVGEADTYTAFPKSWLLDRNAFDKIGKLSAPARVMIVDPL